MGEVEESSTSLKNFNNARKRITQKFLSLQQNQRKETPARTLKVSLFFFVCRVKKKVKRKEQREKKRKKVFVRLFVLSHHHHHLHPHQHLTTGTKRYSNLTANTWRQRRIFARLSMATALNSRRSLPIA